MPTVILPFGYPELSGTFSVVVYQGVLARVYTLPEDPRTGDQTFNRMIFKDVKRMLATFGPWARGAVRGCLGRYYHTTLYQLIKADQDGWWSAALAAFDGFSSGQQDAWRSQAPFQATFNDPGRVWFGCAWVIYQGFLEFGVEAWGAAAWGANESAACLTWWEKEITGVLTKGRYNHDAPLIEYQGTWHVVADQYAWDQDWYYVDPGTAGRVHFYWYGSYLRFAYKSNTGQGDFDIYIDGHLDGVNHQYADHGVFLQYMVTDTLDVGLHAFEARQKTQQPDIDYIRISKTKRNTTPYRAGLDGFIRACGDGSLRVVKGYID